jgi:hypothetical protein
MLLPKLTRTLLVIILLPISCITWADGLSDLKDALSRFNDQTPFNAQIHADINSTNAEGSDKINKQGSIDFQTQQNQNGLQILYGNSLLQQIDNEAREKKKNPTAKTPATEAINRFNYSKLSALLYPVRDLEQDLSKAVFVSEEATTFQGKPARLLHLTIPLKNLTAEESKNLKHFKTDLKIWIDENGIPLASHSKGKASGRAMLVIGFEFHFDVHKTYGTTGNRLLTTQLDDSNGGSGAGLSGDESVKATLTLLP